MVESEKNMEQTIALAGLLHDIGKFMQRAETKVISLEANKKTFCPYTNYYGYVHAAYTASFFEDVLNFDIVNTNILRFAANHHKTSDEKEKIIMEADRLSSKMERIDDNKDSSEDNEEEYSKVSDYYLQKWGKENVKKAYQKIRMQSVFDKIELTEENKSLNKNELSSIEYGNLENIFSKEITKISNPKEGDDLKETYIKLWEKFEKEVLELRNIKNFNNFYNQIYYLMQKYTSNIPSSTINYPDISLFDHSRTTAAIASVLNKDDKFIIVEGDLSGIQNFIFKITEGEDKSGVAKKLRGRSFYISMLTEVISRYITDKMNMTIANILYCGGGKFQILLPANKKDEVMKIEKEFNKWLLDSYDGLISCVFAVKELSKNDMNNYSEIIYELSRTMDDIKKKKLISLIEEDENFFIKSNETDKKINICKCCGLKIKSNEEGECELCKEHKEMGKWLTKLNYIVFSKKNIDYLKNEVSFGKFGNVYILDSMSEEEKKNILNSEDVLDVIKVNSTDEKDKIKGFKFIANIVPKAKENIEKIFDEPIHKESPLTFEAIANLSSGDKKIGILKMDVDNLGTIFSFGFSDKIKSISRVASLSRNLDMFFGGYLNKICDNLYEEWKEEHKESKDSIINELKDKINQIFYITYAGGDDLFIVAPWDYSIKLAEEIRNELKRFTGNNPNIDISGGIALIKPKFPIFKGAEMAEKLLEKSKDNGKGKLTVFGSSIPWDERKDEKSLCDLLKKSNRYLELLESKDINRSLIYAMYELNKDYYKYDKNKEEYVLNIEYFPKAIYKISRTINDKKLMEDILNDIRPNNYFENFKFIGSYILEKTRGGN